MAAAAVARWWGGRPEQAYRTRGRSDSAGKSGEKKEEEVMEEDSFGCVVLIRRTSCLAPPESQTVVKSPYKYKVAT